MKTSSMLLLGLSLFSSTVLANPAMTVMQLSAEVTGNTHVRLRYLTNNWSDWLLSDMVLYGTGHSEWYTTGESTSRDTGSGLQAMSYRYLCDCYVPSGTPLTYKVTAGAPGYISESNLVATVTPAAKVTHLCDDKCLQFARADASVSSPPTVSDPPDAQSSRDDAKISLGAAQGSRDDAKISLDAAQSSQDTPIEKSGGACAFGPQGRAGALSLLSILGLLALGLRRRR